MTRVAVIGAAGFVGAALVRAARAKPDLDVVPIVRADFEAHEGRSFDVVVHTAMPSKRYWAKQNPELDFAETVAKTARIVHRWKFGKLVLVSSMSARAQLGTVYGRHKAAAEALCPPSELVVRLGPMFGEGLDKGVLVDIAAGRPVFVDGASLYAFASVDFVAAWILDHTNERGVVEVGARRGIALRAVAEALGRDVTFEGERDDQVPVAPRPEFPEPEGAIDWLRA